MPFSVISSSREQISKPLIFNRNSKSFVAIV